MLDILRAGDAPGARRDRPDDAGRRSRATRRAAARPAGPRSRSRRTRRRSNLVGIAGGGTPANLQAVKANIDGSAFFAFLAGTAIGFRGGYPALNVDRYLTLYGRLAIATLNRMCQLPALALFAFHHLRSTRSAT